MRTHKQRFHAEILAGHKGEAVLVPFDPTEVWGSQPAEVPRPWRLGHLVRGTLDGHRFEGWIGRRWGRFFMLVDDALQRAAGVAVGDSVYVIVEPRSVRTARASRGASSRRSAARKAPARGKVPRRSARRRSR